MPPVPRTGDASRAGRTYTLALVVALGAWPLGCSFRSGGTGGNNSLGDSSTPIDGEPVSDAGDASPEDVDDDSALASDGDGDDAPSEDSSVDAVTEADAPATCTVTSGDFCNDIAALVGSQVIDGKGDEFCDETTFDVRLGELTDPPAPPTYVSAIAHVRAAWSAVGMHFHIAVKDDTFFPTPSSRPHWQGDSVELFIAGQNVLTGAFDGVIDRGAMQLVFVAGSGAVPSRAGIYMNKGENKSELPATLWTTRLVPGGYEIEVGLPWDVIGGLPPFSKGKKIGVDFAVNDVIDEARTQFFYSVYHLEKPLPGSCGQPFCDDCVWCRSTLGAK